MDPLISVAIITYNQREFLKECIDSVLEQDYQNKEIIVSDDCSTDGTIDLLKKYQNEYPGIFKIVLSPKNNGVTANSNLALFACKGKYVALIAGDDLMLTSKLSKQVKYMETNPDCSICFHDVEYLINDILSVNYCDSRLQNPNYRSVAKLIEINFIPASSVVVRLSDIPKNGFNTRLPIVSDWLFSIETAMNGKIGFINEVLGRYRKHVNNISNNYERCFPDFFQTLAIIDETWPSYSKNTKKSRSNLYRSLGFRKLRMNEKSLGRKLLLESFRLNYFNWKSIACLSMSLFSAKLISKIFARRTVNKIKTRYSSDQQKP